MICCSRDRLTKNTTGLPILNNDATGLLHLLSTTGLLLSGAHHIEMIMTHQYDGLLLLLNDDAKGLLQFDLNAKHVLKLNVNAAGVLQIYVFATLLLQLNV